jgi:hypothetical protein
VRDAAASGLEVMFAEDSVLKVVLRQPLPAAVDLEKVKAAVRVGMSEREVMAVVGPPARAERVGAERDVGELIYGNPSDAHLAVDLLDGKVEAVRSGS